MKKVTVILSMFVFATSSSSFAQKVALQDMHITNPKAPSKAPVQVATAQPNPAAKPAAKPKAVAVPAPNPTPILLPAIQKVRGNAPSAN